jgi:hypothetical protein
MQAAREIVAGRVAGLTQTELANDFVVDKNADVLLSDF